MSRLDDIEARHPRGFISEGTSDLAADLRYLLKVARLAERISAWAEAEPASGQRKRINVVYLDGLAAALGGEAVTERAIEHSHSDESESSGADWPADCPACIAIKRELDELFVKAGQRVDAELAHRYVDVRACIEIADQSVMQEFEDEVVVVKRADWNRIVAVSRGHISKRARQAIERYRERSFDAAIKSEGVREEAGGTT